MGPKPVHFWSCFLLPAPGLAAGPTANAPCWGAGKPGRLGAQDPKAKHKERSGESSHPAQQVQLPAPPSCCFCRGGGGRKRGGQRRRAVQSLKISRIEASTSGRCWGPHRGHLPRGTLQLCPEPPSPTQCPRPIAHCVNLSAHTTRRWRRLLPSRQRAAEEPGWLLCLICISELLWGGGGGNLDETKAVPSIAALLCSV